MICLLSGILKRAEVAAKRIYQLFCTQNTGVIPNKISLILPPPTATIIPSITTPKISIFFLPATSAPEMANAMVPIICKIKSKF